jgi:two-component system response regulator NreC
MIQVIIVDDHPLYIIGLRYTLINNKESGISVMGEVESGEELFELMEHSIPDVVLLDINLPGISGMEVARRMKSDFPTVKILAISAENTIDTIKAMLDIGINGFISKRKSGMDDLVDAIQAVAGGLEYYGRDIASIIFDIYVSKKKTSSVGDEFSDREKEIILACREGLLAKEIAARLEISVNTVNAHKQRIFQKLGINNTMEMVQYALKNGIIRGE